MHATPLKPIQVTLVGVGQMGQALLRGWLSLEAATVSGSARPSLAVRLIHPRPLPEFAALPQATLPDESISRSQVVVFAVKPQHLGQVLPLYKPYLRPDILNVSVAAGKSLDFYAQHLGTQAPVCRVMPNLAVARQEGLIGLLPNAWVTAQHKQLLQHLFAPLGQIYAFSKGEDFDLFTAVAGSGPAFLCAFLEALHHTLAPLGLAAAEGEALILQLVQGTLSTVRHTAGKGALSGEWLANTRKQVTSPGGMTAAGLEVFQQHNLPAIVTQVIQAALRRAQELNAPAGE